MDERELIKSKVDMVALVGETVELKKSGANWKGRCPFHSEKTPSFMVNQELGIYKCFGCGEGGDCFSWLMKIEGLSFRESIVALAEKTGVTLSNKVFDTNDQEKQEILSCLEKASSFYKYILHKQEVGAKARDYLANRGITKEAQNEFGLGYAPEDWGILMRMLGKAGFSESVMEKAGLITGDGRKYDRFRARVTFELRNVRGQIVGLSGRIIEKNDKAPKYINSPETLVYHKGQMVFGLDVARNAIRENGRLIIVEGELDLI